MQTLISVSKWSNEPHTFRWRLDIRTKAGRVQGVNHKYFRLIQRSDGYSYNRRSVAVPKDRGFLRHMGE